MQNLLLVTETFFLELSIPKLNNRYLYYAAAGSLNIPSHTWKKPALEYDAYSVAQSSIFLNQKVFNI